MFICWVKYYAFSGNLYNFMTNGSSLTNLVVVFHTINGFPVTVTYYKCPLISHLESIVSQWNNNAFQWDAYHLLQWPSLSASGPEVYASGLAVCLWSGCMPLVWEGVPLVCWLCLWFEGVNAPTHTHSQLYLPSLTTHPPTNPLTTHTTPLWIERQV